MKLDQKNILYLVFSVLVISALMTIYDFKEPRCVEAQNCYPVRPRIIYAGQSASGVGCDTDIDVHSLGSLVGIPWLGITGFSTTFNSNDNHIAEHAIEITNVGIAGGTINLDFRSCLADQAYDDGYGWSLNYVLVAWQ